MWEAHPKPWPHSDHSASSARLDLACLMAFHPALRKAKFFQIASSSLTSTAEVFVVSTSGHEAIRSIQSILNGILAMMPEKTFKVCEFGPSESLAPSFRHQLPRATCHKGMPPSCRARVTTSAFVLAVVEQRHHQEGDQDWLFYMEVGFGETVQVTATLGCEHVLSHFCLTNKVYLWDSLTCPNLSEDILPRKTNLSPPKSWLEDYIFSYGL